MKRDSRLSATLHVLLHMADRGAPMTSEELAACLHTNPVVVRRTMAGLRRAGLVRSGKGHGGGWTLARALEAITLGDVHRALGEPALIALGHRSETPQCLVEQAVNAALGEAFAEAEALLAGRFDRVRLSDLAADFSRRFDERRRTHARHDHAL
ncbi:Rrf2 family transcriptional regulator [Bosea sp. CS1GBMeth4]|uniref:Rrf2 family transcriptional regulator n=1 Tax=Bosea sp. CS1GBMeth4 TaxID=1892849 RepID=UPI0016496C10|nr:Rrf2 family transcriptional regulator [Bosea sp. CS1GBMeth4]